MTQEQMMNEKELVQVKPGDKLLKGQLIGFKGINDKISTAYPVYSQVDEREYNFVLFERNGKPVLDNDWIRDDRNHTWTNKEPIIVQIGNKGLSTLHNELSEIFNSQKT